MKNLFATLRAEAEHVGEANKLMLLSTRSRGRWGMVGKFSGRSSQTKLEVGGAALSCGSFVGLMAVAVANQAAALGTSTLLATASTALAGLGTVAVGAAVLPVATVATLGGAVVGLGILASSRLVHVDHSKGFAIANAVGSQDRAGLQFMGKENVGAADWLQGAKNYFVRSIKETLFGEQGRKTFAQGGREAAFDYEMADLFSESVDDANRCKQAVVEKLGGDIWEKFGVLVSDESIHACLGQTRQSGLSVGKVLAVDVDRGVVVQSIGRGKAIVHNLKDFELTPEVGKELSVSYRGGRVQKALDQVVSRVAGLSR